MRRFIVFILLLLCTISIYSAKISFSGGYSKVVIKDGKKSVNLSQKATVSIDSLNIVADEITLSGDEYNKVECIGNIIITDDERGLSMKTNRLYYDRNTQRLIINSWCELSDRKNEIEAYSASLSYDLDAEILRLEMSARLLKNTSSGILNAKSEAIIFNRNANTLTLIGGAKVVWNNNTYNAEVMSVNLDSEEIHLEGSIEGEVNG